MTVSSKDKKIIVIMLGVLTLAFSYFAVYRPTISKNSVLESEIAVLNTRVEYLKGLIEQEDFYLSETTRMGNEVDTLLEDYPSYLLIENEIMNIVDSENTTDASIPTLTVGDPSFVEVETSTASTLSNDGSTVSSEAASKYSLYAISTNVSYTATYDGMKKLLNYVSDNEDKHSVTSFTATLDNSTGELTGVMTYSAYYIYGQDKAYEEADIPTINHGTENIFGSIDYDVVSESAEGEEAAESEE